MNKPEKLEIGGIKIANPLILAPMAGVSDRPFRTLASEGGAAVVCAEMVSANAVKYGNKKTFEFIDIGKDEGVTSMQLFGPDPETFAYAIERLDYVPYDILDINMGCPMPKIVKNGEGCALMKDPALAADIVKTCVRVSGRPVTVKMRAGLDAYSINAVELAKRCEDAGASAVAVHGRTRDMLYSGYADLEIIRKVKEAVSIPVIGNGDVTGPRKARRMLCETGCDFVMIGRGSRGKPWIFGDILKHLENDESSIPDEEITRPSASYLLDIMLRHARMQAELSGETLGICKMRKHIAWYTSGYPNSASVREAVNAAVTYDELSEILTKWLLSFS